MGDAKLRPYLFFHGECREAMEFYRGIFGGELKLQSYDEVPGDHPGMDGKLIHAELDGPLVIMACDAPGDEKAGAGRISLSITGTKDDALREAFDAMSDDGKVTSPLKTEFWGDAFGMLTDKYGIDWMINISKPETKAD